ncbi:MAG: CDP-diacylglycerol--serine O-phosphatidyltransferase [Nevskiaceae bacterium]|nr:MAG: CDP-diacylglycerol--serine O-phosphatidyltransferase [Nevskiaceae bacterium]TBR74673.1 MAG: CDP-diacylglycerol--serine O-phosphatidyltransferase [Nevskiaceae bacterium]
MENPSPSHRRRRGIYLLPSLFTTGTLFGGFFAIIASMDGRFDLACIGVLFSMIVDSLDGRIARLTNTTTEFGREYDSLCDLVAFGIAASVVVYAYSLQTLSQVHWLHGQLGAVIALLYAVCTALRLARFNVLTAIAHSNKNFYGLPSPAAAAVVVFFVWTAHGMGYEGQDVVVPAALLTLFSALLMVSNVRYYSFKKLNLSRRMRFVPFAVVVIGLAVVSIDPPRILFGVFFLYALSGPVLTTCSVLRRRSAAAG